jgi:hypothetical protein
MDFLNFRVEEVDDRVSSLEAMASTRIDLHAKVMTEVQAVLDWLGATSQADTARSTTARIGITTFRSSSKMAGGTPSP